MKYIIFDLDKTILNDKGILTDHTLDILNKCRKNGYLLVINTARSKINSLELFDRIKPDFSIYFAGAIIANKNNDVIYTNEINLQSANTLLNHLHKNKLYTRISIETIDTVFSENYDYVQCVPNAKYISIPFEIKEPVMKIIIESSYQKTITNIAKNLNLEYVNYGNTSWGRISNASKYLGNKALFQLLNDSSPKDYVFGDDMGDLEMIEHAHCGVLLKNANSLYYPKANFVTKLSNNEEGFADFIEEHILSIE